MGIQGMLTTIVPICTNIVQLLEDNPHFQMHVTKSFTFILFNRQLQCWVVATTNNLLVEIHVKETFERLGFNVDLGFKIFLHVCGNLRTLLIICNYLDLFQKQGFNMIICQFHLIDMAWQDMNEAHDSTSHDRHGIQT